MNSTLSEQVEIITHKVEQTKVSATSSFFECSGPVTRRVSWQNILFKNQESRVFVHCSQTLYSVTSRAASGHVLLPFEWYECPKNNPKKVFDTNFPCIFYAKTEWNGLQILTKQKSLQETNILPQQQKIPDIFRPSASAIGWLRVLPKHP